MFGIVGRPQTPQETARLKEAKRLVCDGFKAAVAAGAPKGAGRAGRRGDGRRRRPRRQATGRSARDAGREVRPGPVFDFEFGEDFGDHIEAFDPDFAKVLVRWNPDDDAGIKGIQGERLAPARRVAARRRPQVPLRAARPRQPRQLGLVGGDAAATTATCARTSCSRPSTEIQDAGVEPDVWKIEGIDAAEDCELIANLARADGRDGVMSVVLGRGADDAKVDHWLRTGAPVPGYAGFAIGRSIWWDGRRRMEGRHDDARRRPSPIAANYRRFIDVYERRQRRRR